MGKLGSFLPVNLLRMGDYIRASLCHYCCSIYLLYHISCFVLIFFVVHLLTQQVFVYLVLESIGSL